MKGEFIYANGMTIGNVKKIARFYFGDFFKEIEKNPKELTFEIYVRSEIKSQEGILKIEDFVDIDYFKEFWGKAWNINLIESKKI